MSDKNTSLFLVWEYYNFWNLHKYIKRLGIASYILLNKYRQLWIQVWIPSEPAIACSKLTMQTLEQGMKYVQS